MYRQNSTVVRPEHRVRCGPVLGVSWGCDEEKSKAEVQRGTRCTPVGNSQKKITSAGCPFLPSSPPTVGGAKGGRVAKPFKAPRFRVRPCTGQCHWVLTTAMWLAQSYLHLDGRSHCPASDQKPAPLAGSSSSSSSSSRWCLSRVWGKGGRHVACHLAGPGLPRSQPAVTHGDDSPLLPDEGG